jgi:hypothetical protein
MAHTRFRVRRRRVAGAAVNPHPRECQCLSCSVGNPERAPVVAPPSVPAAPAAINVADMLRRTAELSLERAEHEVRRAKAEADMAELLLERMRRSPGPAGVLS